MNNLGFYLTVVGLVFVYKKKMDDLQYLGFCLIVAGVFCWRFL